MCARLVPALHRLLTGTGRHQNQGHLSVHSGEWVLLFARLFAGPVKSVSRSESRPALPPPSGARQHLKMPPWRLSASGDPGSGAADGPGFPVTYRSISGPYAHWPGRGMAPRHDGPPLRCDLAQGQPTRRTRQHVKTGHVQCPLSCQRALRRSTNTKSTVASV